MNNNKFPVPLDVERLNATNWKLTSGYKYIDDQHGLIIVPTGFITDFASIPKFMWSIAGAPSEYAPSATIHDYLCRNKIFARKECDKVFYRAMIYSGVNKVKAMLFYLAVRGYSNWLFLKEQVISV